MVVWWCLGYIVFLGCDVSIFWIRIIYIKSKKKKMILNYGVSWEWDFFFFSPCDLDWHSLTLFNENGFTSLKVWAGEVNKNEFVHFHISHVGMDPSLGPCKQKAVVLFRSGVVSFYNLFDINLFDQVSSINESCSFILYKICCAFWLFVWSIFLMQNYGDLMAINVGNDLMAINGNCYPVGL